MNRLLDILGGCLALASGALSAACTSPPDSLARPTAEEPASAPMGQALREALRTAGPDEPIRVLVTLEARVDITAIEGDDKHARRGAIIQALQTKASQTQGGLLSLLHAGGATEVTPLWIINGVAATVTPALARALASAPSVLGVELDSTVHVPSTQAGAASGPEWNIAAIAAPSVWSVGFNGAGAVVANMDTGVDIHHTDLQSRWRGGTDSWFDPYGNTAAPYDALGHGTQTMGIMVGGTAGGTAIGVAPGAKWIAAKIYDDAGNATISVIHQAFQWLLAPSGVPGAPDAPDVVDASWGMSGVNACDDTFQADFEALRASGIVIAFAAGNSGPSPMTSVSPANNIDGFSAGAVDAANGVASFSSRGPSACTGLTFPDTVAPGVDVKTSDISLGGTPLYAYVSGTSFSAPHVAGIAALLAGAFPAASAADVEQAIRSTAHDLGPAGPDDDYGFGLVDAFAAYNSLAGVPPPSITTASLGAAHAGKPYSQALAAQGGVTPYTWSLSAGALPPGLSLGAATGIVSGTPTKKGVYAFTARVQDSHAAVATKPLSITVQKP